MTNRTCHVCGSANLSSWCPGLLECGICTHVQADIELSNEALAELYGHKYFHGEEYVDYATEREALNLNFERRLSDLIPIVPPNGKLYEIGCAYGYFLLAAAVKGLSVAGCDISSHAVNMAQEAGLNVICADYLKVPAPSEPYDIVCMWDTIEHLANPKGYVEKTCRELAPGGLLVISTGDAASRVARLRRENWRMVHPPTHLHYFTSTSVSRMLQNAGFSQVRVVHNAFYRNVSSSLVKISNRMGSRALRSVTGAALKIPGFKSLAVPLNLWDIMTVYASK